MAMVTCNCTTQLSDDRREYFETAERIPDGRRGYFVTAAELIYTTAEKISRPPPSI
jgi:hypothetical protein